MTLYMPLALVVLIPYVNLARFILLSSLAVERHFAQILFTLVLSAFMLTQRRIFNLHE